METIKRSLRLVTITMVPALALMAGCVANGADEYDPSEQLADASVGGGREGDPVSMIGTARADVTQVGGKEGARTDVRYFLRTGPDGGEEVELTFREPAIAFVPGSEVTVRGSWQGEGSSRSIAVDEVTPAAEQVSPIADQAASHTLALSTASTARVPTARKVAVLLVGSTKLTLAGAAAKFNTYTAGSPAAFIAENSGMLDTFESKAFALPSVDTSGCGVNASAIKDAAWTAFKSRVSYASSYDIVAYIIGGNACPFFGYATTGKPGSTSAQSLVVSESASDAGPVTHELSHTIGFDHANSTRCGANVYNAHRTGCTDKEYGNTFDVMSVGTGGKTAPNGHYGAPSKRFAGYLAGCDDVTAGSSAIFQISPTEGSCGTRSVRVPIAGESNYYYLEYRKHGAGEFSYVLDNDGVLLNVSNDPSSGPPQAYLLDGTPETESVKDAFLTVGRTYHLPGGVGIIVQSLGDTATIKVTTSGTGAAKCRGGTLPPSSAGKIGGLCTAIGPITLQAEDATSHPNATIANKVSGYSGAGYALFGAQNSQLAWSAVNIPRYDSFGFTFRYANPTSSRKAVAILINGKPAKVIGLPPTGALPNWGTATVVIPMGRGQTAIQVGPQASGVLIDQLVIKPR